MTVARMSEAISGAFFPAYRFAHAGYISNQVMQKSYTCGKSYLRP